MRSLLVLVLLLSCGICLGQDYGCTCTPAPVIYAPSVIYTAPIYAPVYTAPTVIYTTPIYAPYTTTIYTTPVYIAPPTTIYTTPIYATPIYSPSPAFYGPAPMIRRTTIYPSYSPLSANDKSQRLNDIITGGPGSPLFMKGVAAYVRWTSR